MNLILMTNLLMKIYFIFELVNKKNFIEEFIGQISYYYSFLIFNENKNINYNLIFEYYI